MADSKRIEGVNGIVDVEVILRKRFASVDQKSEIRSQTLGRDATLTTSVSAFLANVARASK